MSAMEVGESREEIVGAMRVRRALPRRGRRTVGAWCFADHIGPALVTRGHGLDVGPHPHMGLQTVTWLIDGEALHRDSLGSEQLITPGQLNLMSAGRGVSHAEEATSRYEGRLQGIQLWVAQPESTRHGAPAFDHLSDLPVCDLEGATATVLVGTFADAESPARRDSEIVGVDLVLWSDLELVLRSDFEYALIVLEGGIDVEGATLVPGKLGYLGTGRDMLAINMLERSRIMLLGGEPIDGPIMMWWNFVGRSREKLVEAYRSWNDDDGRFGTVSSSLKRIEAPPPHWLPVSGGD